MKRGANIQARSKKRARGVCGSVPFLSHLTDSVHMDRTLGHQEEAGRTHRTPLAVSTAAAEVAVLLRATAATGHEGATHLQ